jgi:serine/threonine-protein kinase HipA
VLSYSLPPTTGRPNATHFLHGLLPEGAHLDAMARLAKVSTNDTYGMLRHFGRDIAGAFVITSDAEPGDARWALENLSEQQLVDELRGLTNTSLGLHHGSELSIAGIQNKMLLVQTEVGRCARPRFGYPSSHIVKLDDRRGLAKLIATRIRQMMRPS